MHTKQNKFHLLVDVFFILACLAVIVPMWLVVAISFTAESAIMKSGYSFIPSVFSFEGYGYIFKSPMTLIRAYGVTAFTSAVGVFGSLVIMLLVAYALSRKEFKARRVLSFYLFFTMLFSGGLVPSYILITQYLHLNNSIWVYIIPSLINVWYIFLLRTSIQNLPEAVIESARMDGAGEFRILFQLVVPIAKPGIATVALYVLLNFWNSWQPSLLYMNNDKLITLQYMLQKMLKNIEFLTKNMENLPEDVSSADIPGENIRMAMALLVAGPMLVIFPFFQKYFTKGIVVGSVKG